MKVRSKQQGEALQFTGGRESADDIAKLVGNLAKARYRPARSGASPAVPAQPESILLVLPRSGKEPGRTTTMGKDDWIVKIQDKVTAYTDAGFRTFWEPATIVEQVPADAYQEPHKALPDPDQEVDSDQGNDEPEGSSEGEGLGEEGADERDLDPSDPGDLLPDPEGQVVVANEVGQPGEVGGTE